MTHQPVRRRYFKCSIYIESKPHGAVPGWSGCLWSTLTARMASGSCTRSAVDERLQSGPEEWLFRASQQELPSTSEQFADVRQRGTQVPSAKQGPWSSFSASLARPAACRHHDLDSSEKQTFHLLISLKPTKRYSFLFYPLGQPGFWKCQTGKKKVLVG